MQKKENEMKKEIMSKPINMFSKLTAEFLGTFALVLIGCGSAVIAGKEVGFLGISLAFGLTVTVMAYAFGSISGGHFNPAVTFGLLLNRLIKINDAVWYVLAQTLGAIAGSTVLLNLNSGGFGQNFIQSGYNMTSGIIGELVFSILFMIVILASTSKNANTKFAPIAIGLMLTLAHIVLIPVTGTSLNPARSFGPALYAGGDALNQLWIFVLFPMLGTGIGALIWKYMLSNEK